MMLTKSKHSSFIVQSEQRCSQKFMTSNFDKSGPDNDHSARTFFQTVQHPLQLTNLQQPTGPQTQPSKQEVTPKRYSNISFASSMTLVNKVFAINILPVLLSLAIFRPDKLGLKLPPISAQELHNFSCTWFNPGLLQVLLAKNTSYSENIKFILRATAVQNPEVYFDLTSEISADDDDPNSDQLMTANLCKECRIRSSRCKTCKWLNSHKSLEELHELQLLRDSIAITMKY